MSPGRARASEAGRHAVGILMAVSLAACGVPPASSRERVRVSRVLDGDTVDLADGRRVRYLLVDTPETAHAPGEPSACFGEEATALNVRLVLGRVVTLEYDERLIDDYGRTLAYVYLGDVMVSEILVERGYGCVLVVPPNDRYAEELESLERAARAAGKGLWSACAGALPEVCR